MKKLLVLLLLLYPLTASADFYQWTDERGTVNFAEDLGKVPKKFRKKARKVGAEDEAAPAPQKAPVSESAPASDGAAQKGEQAQVKKVYGGKDEAAWRREFLQAKFDLETAQTELSTLQGRLGDTSKMSRAEYVAIRNSIKHAEARVQVQQKKLEDLERTADRYAVPADFRK